MESEKTSMEQIHLLKEKYHLFPESIKDSKRKIGTELEFHIITKNGSKPDFNLFKNILNLLLPKLGFQTVEYDYEGNSIKGKKDLDIISYEYGYGIIELSLAPSTDLHSIANKTFILLDQIQKFLSGYQLTLLPLGFNPFPWAKEIPYIKNPYYEALHCFFDHFNLKEKYSFVDTNAFICANQVHLDLSVPELPDFINALNKISWVKALLFANSPFIDEEKIKCFCFRDILWKDLALAEIPSNVLLHEKKFSSFEDILSVTLENSIFHVKRDNQFIIFKPMKLGNFLKENEISGFLVKDHHLTSTSISPLPSDIYSSRPYNPVVITPRGTVEIRSECEQPFNSLMAPLAFHWGFMHNKDEIYQHLNSIEPFIKNFTNLELRSKAIFLGYNIQKDLSFDIKPFIFKLLTLIEAGLKRRNLKEEIYLKPLFSSFDKKASPAEELLNKISNRKSIVDLISELCNFQGYEKD